MDFKKDLEHWAKIWDKAVEKKIFPQKEEIIPSAQQTKNSFFGLINRPDDAPEAPLAPDVEYWNKVYKMSTHAGSAPDILSENAKEMEDILNKNPNPIKKDTVGVDQDLTPESLSATFSEKDIEDLSVLKVKLHELQSKLNEFEGRGDNSKKFEDQITKLKKQIDDLSNSLNISFNYK
jgi:hypothetical protein